MEGRTFLLPTERKDVRPSLGFFLPFLSTGTFFCLCPHLRLLAIIPDLPFSVPRAPPRPVLFLDILVFSNSSGLRLSCIIKS